MSIGRGMDKEDEVHMYGGTSHNHTREWNHERCSSKDGPGNYHTK